MKFLFFTLSLLLAASPAAAQNTSTQLESSQSGNPVGILPTPDGATSAPATKPSEAFAPLAAETTAPTTPAPMTISTMPAPATAPTASTEPAAAPAAALETGRIQGVIIDKSNAETLIEARIEVIGTGKTALTDLDGRYTIDLPPGLYELRIVNPPYKTQRVKNVEVKVGFAAVVDIAMRTDSDAVEEVVVVVDPDRTRAHIQLVIRQKSAVVSDILSAEEMSKTGDGTASEAVRRATGASVVGGKFIYVRGLGERYSYSMLNDSRLPSPEPDKQVVPLDLFPTGILSNVTIVKTASPDLPGDFAGGAVKLETKQFPEKRLFQLGASVGFNSITTFRDMLSYRGGKTDYLGFDDGTRAFPERVPTNGRLFRGSEIDGHKLTAKDMTAIGREFNNDFELTKQRALPNQGYSLAYGDTVDLADRPFGFLASLSYSNSYQRTQEIQKVFAIKSRNTKTGEVTLDTNSDYVGERGNYSVLWSGLGDLNYRFTRNQKISFTTLYTLTSDKEARRLEGRDKNLGSDIEYTRQYYLTRSLWFNQLRGEHQFKPFTLAWRGSYSEANREEPDLRELTRSVGADNNLLWVAKASSGGHFFSELVEPSYSGGADATIPFRQWNDLSSNFKVGFLETNRSRRFDVRRFRFTPEEEGDPRLYQFEPNELFSDNNIGTNVRFEEASRSTDNYRGEQSIHAGYLMTDLALAEQWRVIAGLRLEKSTQEVRTVDPFNPQVKAIEASLENTDPLPSANLVYALNAKSNVRLGYAKTIARPELRELAPFSFADFYGGSEVYGNPDLKRTSIQNFDLRYEIFPESGEVLALSGFYKRFIDPIEQIIIPSGTLARSFANADRANNFGAELEARKNFGFLAAVLKPFYGAGNLTLVRSTVHIGSQSKGAQTSRSRPLQGQSDYLFNATLGYESKQGLNVQTTYNVFGKRIDQVGALGMPDIYELPRHTVDATIIQKFATRWEVKATGENLLDSAQVFKQGSDTVERSYKGINFGLGIGYKL